MPRASDITQINRASDKWRGFANLIVEQSSRLRNMSRMRTRSTARMEEQQYSVEDLYDESNVRLEDSPASIMESVASTIRRNDDIAIIGSQLLSGAVSTSQVEYNARTNQYGRSRSPTPGYGTVGSARPLLALLWQPRFA